MIGWFSTLTCTRIDILYLKQTEHYMNITTSLCSPDLKVLCMFSFMFMLKHVLPVGVWFSSLIFVMTLLLTGLFNPFMSQYRVTEPSNNGYYMWVGNIIIWTVALTGVNMVWIQPAALCCMSSPLSSWCSVSLQVSLCNKKAKMPPNN